MIVFTKYSEDFQTIFYKNVSNKPLDVEIVVFSLNKKTPNFTNRLRLEPNVEYFTWLDNNSEPVKILFYDQHTTKLLAPFISNALESLNEYEYKNFVFTKQDDELISILNNLNLNGLETKGGTDKATRHNYTSTYAKYLKKIQSKSINFVEIGVLNGGSMAMWCKYLPQAKFLFFDIENQIEESIKKHIDWNRVKLHISSAYTNESVQLTKEYFNGGIDFLLDDGPHTLESMMDCITLYSPLMNKGGTIMIEDVQGKDWFPYLSSVCPPNTTIETVDLTKSGRHDDLIFIVNF
jgi:hypothetical protein